MSEKKKYCAPAVGCLGLIILVGLVIFLLFLIFKPNSTSVEEVSGRMVEKNNFIDVDPTVDMHGSGCWAAIGVLAVLLFLMISAAMIYPKLQARRNKRRAKKEELALKLTTMEREAEEQRSAAAAEIATLRSANDERMRALNSEVIRLKGETKAITAHQSSRDRLMP